MSSQPEQQETTSVCQFCFGSGMESTPQGARRCRCRQAGERERRVRAAQIPPLYEDSTLSTFKPGQGQGTQLRAFNYAFRLVKDFPAVTKGILFQGPIGVGKTHLACGILHGILEKGATCLFYEFGRLLKEIQSSYNPISQASEMDVLKPALETEVLVLDELGATRPTEWMRDTLLQIINTRYNYKRLTIVTTNYMDQPSQTSPETLADRIGARLRSRLYQMCHTVLIEGEDYRKNL